MRSLEVLHIKITNLNNRVLSQLDRLQAVGNSGFYPESSTNSNAPNLTRNHVQVHRKRNILKQESRPRVDRWTHSMPHLAISHKSKSAQ
jgi:hypothetical protein